MNLKGNKLRMKGKYLMKKLEDIMKTLIKLELKMQLKGKSIKMICFIKLMGRIYKRKKKLMTNFMKKERQK